MTLCADATFQDAFMWWYEVKMEDDTVVGFSEFTMGLTQVPPNNPASGVAEQGASRGTDSPEETSTYMGAPYL